MLWSGAPGEGGAYLSGLHVAVTNASARLTLEVGRRYLVMTDTALVWRQGGSAVVAQVGVAGNGYLAAGGGVFVEARDEASRYLAVIRQAADGHCYALARS